MRRCLVDGGWLIVSPNDGAQVSSGQFTVIHRPGAIIHQKRQDSRSAGMEAQAFSPGFATPDVSAKVTPMPLPPQEAIDERTPEFTPKQAEPVAEAANYSHIARNLANEGRLTDALESCNCWVASEKLDARAHYLQAVILQEIGDKEAARQAVQRAIYLQPNLIVAHFTAGNLARDEHQTLDARRHFNNALRLLAALEPKSALPEADGLTAGRLTDIIESLLAMDATS
jgi:chemotaxis protein methyltransferase CheR